MDIYFTDNNDFNPRSPCGERHLSNRQAVNVKSISIHAPRVGSDSKDAQIFLSHLRQKGYFFVIFSKLGTIFRGLAEKGGGISFLDRCEPPGENMGAWRSRSENQ